MGGGAQLNDFHSGASCILAHEPEASELHVVEVIGVDFPSVAVSLVDVSLAIETVSMAVVSLEAGLPASESHRSAKVGPTSFRHEDDGRRFGVRGKLRAVGVSKAEHITSELNYCQLQAEADSKVRYFTLSGILDSQDHPFNSSCTEASWNNNSISCLYLNPRVVVLLCGFVFEITSVDPGEVQFSSD